MWEIMLVLKNFLILKYDSNVIFMNLIIWKIYFKDL